MSEQPLKQVLPKEPILHTKPIYDNRHTKRTNFDPLCYFKIKHCASIYTQLGKLPVWSCKNSQALTTPKKGKLPQATHIMLHVPHDHIFAI